MTWGDASGGGDSSGVASQLTAGVDVIYATHSTTHGAFAAKKTDGSVVTWGEASRGGDSSGVASQLTAGVDVIYAAYDAFAAKTDGSVVTWGHASRGGDSSGVASQLTAGVDVIYATELAFAAKKTDGSVVTWGDASTGGDSSGVASQLTAGVDVIYATLNAFAAKKTDASVVTWGDETRGGNVCEITNTTATATVTTTSTTTTVTGTTAAAVAATYGDPIAWYQGQKIKFWLPNYQFLPLLTTPELTVWASTFEGPKKDLQWFEHMIITGAKNETMVDVKVRRTHPSMNASHFARGSFRQLDIRIGNRQLRVLSDQMFGSLDGKVQVGVGARLYPNIPPRVHFTRLVEFVMVESKSISFFIHASHAGVEFPKDVDKQVLYTHLDWECLEMPGVEHFQGILPELWGTVPRTPEVEAMLTAPSKRGAQATCPELLSRGGGNSPKCLS